jgi:SSS family solute:Na+ symporter
MVLLDYFVLLAYFAVMIGIGLWSARRIRKQEDYFMGKRSFGKLLQTFAAFGAGTGSSDPVNVGRDTFLYGLSGMWSVMYWLFVTPFYWITGVWYRRMRHLTLGDWFVERYESKALGAGYCSFGLLFFMVYGAMLFAAIGKLAAPLINIPGNAIDLFGEPVPLEYVLVPVIGLVVLIYGVAGGLEAAYYTDLVQGFCIIFLSIILIPIGLHRLGGDNGMLYGFTVIHERLPAEHFNLFGTSTSEFPWYRIAAVVVINLIGVVIQPHFIATGGGSARTEMSARVGLVTGNFLKRFCTVGWVLTGMIGLALFASSPELLSDPEKTWGVVSRELLGPGLTGLMLACLLAALMSSVDAQMVVGSALVVRNIYAPYINPNASEKEYVFLGRLTGALIVFGAVLLSLLIMNVFDLLKLTWIVNVLFAAPFWIGMYWRRATTAAAWTTVAFSAGVFFVIPFLAPMLLPALRTMPDYLGTNTMVQTVTIRKAAQTDVEQRQEKIRQWDAASQKQENTNLGQRPQALKQGDPFEEITVTGGQSVFWVGGVKPVDEQGNVLKDVKSMRVSGPERIDEKTVEYVLAYPEGVRLMGFGDFRPDFLLYQWAGVDLTQLSNSMLATLELPPKIISPFLVMIFISLVTPRNRTEALDRYYAKMNTPVDPDPEKDRENLAESYAQPDKFESGKVFPGSSLEFQKPSAVDVIGVVVCFAICFLVIALALGMVRIGG